MGSGLELRQGHVLADSPATEKQEKANQGGPDHGPGRGEDPMVEGCFFGQLFGFLGHNLKFGEEHL